VGGENIRNRFVGGAAIMHHQIDTLLVVILMKWTSKTIVSFVCWISVIPFIKLDEIHYSAHINNKGKYLDDARP
jgi:hypothetical protein